MFDCIEYLAECNMCMFLDCRLFWENMHDDNCPGNGSLDYCKESSVYSSIRVY